MASYLSIDGYVSKVQAMDQLELSQHLRDDYRHDDQQWPDYLDYIEEWDYSYASKLISTRKDFIYLVLARKHQKMLCGDHHHTFSTQNREDVIYVPNPDAYLDFSACWYKTLIQHDNALRAMDQSTEVPRLSAPEATIIKSMTQMRLMLDEGLTYDKLSFQQFKDQWWSKESREQATKLFSEARTSTPKTPKDIIAKAMNELPPAKPQWLGSDTPAVIDSVSRVLEDHGFHALIRVREDRNVVLNIINDIRSSTDPSTAKITHRNLAGAMARCKRCMSYDNIPTSTSYPGVYYAPPGNGKTTCLQNETFIGIDTDWLISMSNYNTVIEPFIRLGIPVLTNQYHLCQNSGERFFGMFNPAHLRLRADKKPHTSLREIISAQSIYKDDLCVLFTEEYLENVLPILYRMNFIYNLVRGQWMIRSQPKVRSIPDQTVAFLSPIEVITQLKAWSQQGSGVKHRSRVKAKHHLQNADV